MEDNIPKHVAVIMDGNGRWATERGLQRIEGHKAGIASVKRMVECCLKKEISCLSLFAFSSENWSRPSEEVNFLMGLFLEAIRKELPELNHQGIQMRFTGDRTPLSALLQHQMQDAEFLTKNNRQLVLNIVMNYGGKWDLFTAAKKMAEAVISGKLLLSDLNETHLAGFLATQGLPDPDLFIRTSGELRISNFYLWQLAYTELYFTDINWPDFNESHFEQALAAFNKRDRRFGNVT